MKTPRTTKTMLKHLRNFMEGDTSLHEKRMLWNILTALRGPDSDDENLKMKTTARIRYAVFGDCINSNPWGFRGFSMPPNVGAFSRPGRPETNYDNASILCSNDHFKIHVYFAVKTLDELNMLPPEDVDKPLSGADE